MINPFVLFGIIIISTILLIPINSVSAVPAPQFLFDFASSGSGNGEISGAVHVSIDNSGNVYVIENGNDRVSVFNSTGGFLFKFGSFGTSDGKFVDPTGVVVGPISGNVYVMDKNNARVQIFDSNGNFLGKFGSFGTADGQFNFPQGIGVDKFENIYVPDTFNQRIQKFDSAGNHLLTFGGPFGNTPGKFKEPSSVAIADNGDVYVTDTRNHRVQVFDSAGNFAFKFGSFGTGDGQFGLATRGITLDDNGNAYVGDALAGRYQVFDATGVFLTKFGSLGTGDGQFLSSHGTPDIDSQGRIYVPDVRGDRIQVFSGLNSPPDCSAALPSNDLLWPPNHKFVTISIGGITDADGDATTLTITGITQDEAVDAKGSGKTSPDGEINGDTADVRSERTGKGDGRVYEISFTVNDGLGGTCSGSVIVGVPHDKKDTAVDSGVRFDSTS